MSRGIIWWSCLGEIIQEAGSNNNNNTADCDDDDSDEIIKIDKCDDPNC